MISTGKHSSLPEKSQWVEKKIAYLTLGVTSILTGFMKLPQSSFDKSEKWDSNLSSSWISVVLKGLIIWFIKKKI